MCGLIRQVMSNSHRFISPPKRRVKCPKMPNAKNMPPNAQTPNAQNMPKNAQMLKMPLWQSSCREIKTKSIVAFRLCLIHKRTERNIEKK